MSCAQFTPGTAACQTIQLIEPDQTLPVSTIGVGGDQSLSEFGDMPLTPGMGVVQVTFNTPKAGDYRFDYLYVDALYSTDVNPGVVNLVPFIQTIYGFSVDLAGVALSVGYVLRWRVLVVTLAQLEGSLIDAPENLYVPMPYVVPPISHPPGYTLTVNFVNLRSNTNYGFSELRVENLVDQPDIQVPLIVQVVTKTIYGFTIAASPFPNSSNYYLKARTP